MNHPELSSSLVIENADLSEDWIAWIPGTFQTGRCFWSPLSLGLCKPVSQGSASLLPSSHSCVDAVSGCFSWWVSWCTGSVNTTPSTEAYSSPQVSVSPFMCDSINARWPYLCGWLNNLIDLSCLPALEKFEYTQQCYHFYLLST